MSDKNIDLFHDIQMFYTYLYIIFYAYISLYFIYTVHSINEYTPSKT